MSLTSEVKTYLDKWFDERRDALISDLARLCAVRSVFDTPKPGAPYGEPARAALDLSCEIMRSLGFEPTIYKDMLAQCDLGDAALPAVGIIAHVDVVAASGGAWTSDPFTLTERGGSLYARGVTDDKGPAIASIYALAAARDAAIACGATLTSEMEAFFALCPSPIVAVTGSDGKTTTTTIIAELLRAGGFTVHLGGNLGTPLLDKVPLFEASDYAVVELSSFQLMTMQRPPQIAVVTNVSPNHLDKHTDYTEYIDAKRNVFVSQSNSQKLVLNYDNEITRGFAKNANAEVSFFSSKSRPERGVFLDGTVICDAETGAEILKSENIFIPGAHNVENFMAAICAVRPLVSDEIIERVAREFRGVEHRIEFVRELRGVRYYNDSIASSPSRTIAGLRSFDKKVILVAGGRDKGVPFDSLAPEVVARVKTLILTGETAEKIKSAVESYSEYRSEPQIIVESEFERAVQTAYSIAAQGDIVILSPASTSFDRFVNFEERGNYFKNIVNKLQ